MSTTGQKKDAGKPALDLVEPHFIEDVAGVLTFGAQKYDVDNWKKGMAIGKAMAGVLRHCFAVLRGEHLDPETGRQHVAHATCGLMFIHYMVRTGATKVPDDRWGRSGVSLPLVGAPARRYGTHAAPQLVCADAACRWSRESFGVDSPLHKAHLAGRHDLNSEDW